MGFEEVLSQIFQPYFYYSVVLLTVSFFCVKIVLKYCTFLNSRIRSLISLVPLLVPLVVMAVFTPSTVIESMSVVPGIESHTATRIFSPMHGVILISPQTFTMPTPRIIMLTETLSITGVICLLGFALSALFTSVLLVFGDRLTRRALRVIDLGPEDHPWLQAKISELSGKLNISPPKVGFTEDLRPNAFTTGYGGKTTLVFSAGLFGVLSRDEVAAVALHELSHVKNHDFFYKAASNALVTVSFFNPLAYFASSAALREREMLADEGAAKLLEEPSVLRNALAKACRALEKLPKDPLGVRVAASLFVSSSALPRPRLLSVHPSLDERLRNIPESVSSRGKRRFGCRKVALAGILSLVIILLGVITCYGMVKLQSDFMSATPKPMDGAPDFSTLPGEDGFLKRFEGAVGGGFVRSNDTFGMRPYPSPSDEPLPFGVVGAPGGFVRSFSSMSMASGSVLSPFHFDVSTKKELSGSK